MNNFEHLTPTGKRLRNFFRTVWFTSRGKWHLFNDGWGFRRIGTANIRITFDKSYGIHAVFCMGEESPVYSVFQHPIGTWHFNRYTKEWVS
jgi:hypothetical protein